MSIEIQRLVLAKSLYLHGCVHADCKDSVSRMLAIHHFDNAVETVLKCVATKKGIQPKGQQFDFENLLKDIPNLPLVEQVRGLHRIRNAVQHQGDIPSTESVIVYKGYTEDFFREICDNEFGISYDKLFLSQLIENENLREQLLQAEDFFGKHDYKQCITLCDSALESAVFDEADIFYTAGKLTGYWGAADELRKLLNRDYPEIYKAKDYYEAIKEIHGAIIQLGQATMGMQFLDEYRTDFLKHRRIVENMETTSGDELRNNAEYSLNFVINLLLKWQAEGLFEEKRSG